MGWDRARARMSRWACVMSLVLAGGGTTFALGGCDADTSAAVLSGLQDMTTALVDAAFAELSDQLTSTSDTTSTTSTTDTTSTSDSST